MGEADTGGGQRDRHTDTGRETERGQRRQGEAGRTGGTVQRWRPACGRSSPVPPPPRTPAVQPRAQCAQGLGLLWAQPLPSEGAVRLDQGPKSGQRRGQGPRALSVPRAPRAAAPQPPSKQTCCGGLEDRTKVKARLTPGSTTEPCLFMLLWSRSVGMAPLGLSTGSAGSLHCPLPGPGPILTPACSPAALSAPQSLCILPRVLLGLLSEARAAPTPPSSLRRCLAG